jgi:hypothetical protein
VSNYFLPVETFSEIYRGTSPRCGAIKKEKRDGGQPHVIRPSIAADGDVKTWHATACPLPVLCKAHTNAGGMPADGYVRTPLGRLVAPLRNRGKGKLIAHQCQSNPAKESQRTGRYDGDAGVHYDRRPLAWNGLPMHRFYVQCFKTRWAYANRNQSQTAATTAKATAEMIQRWSCAISERYRDRPTSQLNSLVKLNTWVLS